MVSTTSRSRGPLYGNNSRPIRLATKLLTLLLAACGGGGYNGSGNMGPPLAPTVTIAIAPTTITLGQSATLTWYDECENVLREQWLDWERGNERNTNGDTDRVR